MAYLDGPAPAEVGNQTKKKLTKGDIGARIAGAFLALGSLVVGGMAVGQRFERAPEVVDPNLEYLHDKVEAKLTQQAVETQHAEQNND